LPLWKNQPSIPVLSAQSTMGGSAKKYYLHIVIFSIVAFPIIIKIETLFKS
jgi:hypothetical protein